MVFARLKALLSALMNKGMSKLETPEVLAEQAQDQLESSLKKIQQAVVESLTSEKMLQQKIKKDTEELSNWEKRAAVAVSQNNDELARECLRRKQALSEDLASLQRQLEEQVKTSATLKARHAEINQQVQDLQRKKSVLSARSSASDAMTRANQLLSGPSAGPDKWEQKIAEKEFKAQALRELGGQPTADKFAELDKQIQVDDELAALKAKMSAPKLIVDKEAPPKTKVDENVPVVVEEVKDDHNDSGKK